MRGRRCLWMRLTVLAALAGTFVFGAADRTGASSRPRVNPESFIQLAQRVPSLATLRREGRLLYARECLLCHGGEGEGIAGPELAGNDFLNSGGRVVAQIMGGDEERGMPPFGESLKDRQIAAIATYVRNSWGNEFGVVLPDVAGRMR